MTNDLRSMYVDEEAVAGLNPVKEPEEDTPKVYRRELNDDQFDTLAKLINSGAPKSVIRKEECRLKKLHKQMMRA